MWGAIAGDIIGSIYEKSNFKGTDFDLFQTHNQFTDDTVMTIAVAKAILYQEDYGICLKEFGRKYPNRGYGGMFRQWLEAQDTKPYFSYANGSAMRVSTIGWAFDNLEEVLAEAKKSAEVTHNHPQGIKGAQAVAVAVFLAKQGKSKTEIKDFIENAFDYNLSRTIEEIRPNYTFDVSCEGSVPESIIAFLDATDVESAIRLGISLGGDADTIASIAGGIAEAYYKYIPPHILEKIQTLLPEELLKLTQTFCNKYIPNK